MVATLPFLSLCLVGTGLGIVLSSTFGSDWLALMPIFATLSAINLSCNYISLKYVSLNTVNLEVGRIGPIMSPLESG